MNSNKARADQLRTALDLPMAPVAVSFCDSIPAGISTIDETVPAGCSFWQLAVDRCFATSATNHQHCSIGVHTHNLSSQSGELTNQEVELGDTLKAMMGLDYVHEDEVAAIPTMPQSSRHVVYGPLEDLPVDIGVDAVLVFAHARQSLVMTEALARVDQSTPLAMGRPACAVIPQVVRQGGAAMSLGCCGARAYLDKFADGIALWALPGSKLDEYCQTIETMASANRTLSVFHAKRNEAIAAGQTPTVEQSLAALAEV